MSTLDFIAAQAVARAKLLERAVHDAGPWEIEINGLRVPALRMTTVSRVIFLADFPEVCWVIPPEAAFLYCRGDLIASREIIAPAEGAHQIEWTIGLEDRPQTAGV